MRARRLKQLTIQSNLTVILFVLFCKNLIIKLTLPNFILIELLLILEAFVFKGTVVEETGLNMGSTAGIPIRVSKSANMADFSLTSNGVSHPNDGDKLTSKSHGFKCSSTSMSNPYNSEKITQYSCKLHYLFYPLSSNSQYYNNNNIRYNIHYTYTSSHLNYFAVF